MTAPYFEAFAHRQPPRFVPMSARRTLLWHFLAGAATMTGGLYLVWRWGQSLNPEALVFSALVAGAETLFYLGTLLFFFDIWEEGDTPAKPAPDDRAGLGLEGDGAAIHVDVFVTTYDEPVEVVRPTLHDARRVIMPPNVRMRLCLLDDGDRPEMARLAVECDASYFARRDNSGFKAGNLRNGLMHTYGDFVVICDADTRLMPTFLQNTLGYFSDPKVAWVQTPHWFYDVPEGVAWAPWLWRRLGGRVGMPEHGIRARVLQRLGRFCALVSGQDRVGADPFLSDPAVFFDVIQRRRNRNGASFCCGAGSIHRREAVFDNALKRKATQISRHRAHLGGTPERWLATQPLEPYRFHVSEDIYTSISLHEDRTAGWTSVYHPQVEARMLSPWSLEAWAAQRLKYAGGTFDIALRDNPLFRRGLTWRCKLHYGATFWSYLSLFWAPILLLAPVVSLLTGVAPVRAYSIEFFRHFLPAVLASELAILVACKGHALGGGRALGIAALPIHVRALYCCLRGRKPSFAPTPKLPVGGGGFRHVMPHAALLAAMAGAALWGIWQTQSGAEGHSVSLLWLNLFWLGVNMLLVGRICAAAFWRPEASTTSATARSNSSSLQHRRHAHVANRFTS